MTIKINDCPHKCKRINDTVDNPTANENDTECTNDTLYTCKTFYSTCVKWDNGTSCPNNCSNDKITCCSGNLCAGAGEIRCEESTSGGTAQVFSCNRDSSNCLVWDTSGITPCSKNICNGKMCGDCPAVPICTLESKDCVDTKTKKLCGPDQNGCPIWISIPCDGNRTCQNGDCKYVVGSIGPGGGIVFYDNPNYAIDGWQYLEAAKQDQTDSPWGCSGIQISSYAEGIGTGKDNTRIIAENCGDSDIAAKRCWGQNLGNGYTDWFLPSKGELDQLYVQRDTVSGFQTTILYWSSTAYAGGDLVGAWGELFASGLVASGHRVAADHVRCVRGGP